MSREVVEPSAFSPDILEFIRLLHRYEVSYLVVGGEAVIFYGHIRLTGDVGFFFDKDESNTRLLYNVLDEFWEGTVPGLGNHIELQRPGVVFQFGLPPNRIDLLNEIDGVGFSEAWAGRKTVDLLTEPEPIPLNYVGIRELISNKKASARPKDLDDLPYLIQALENRDTSR